MPLRVGFDLDGTVADMYAALYREALVLFGDAAVLNAPDRATKPQEVPGEQSNKKPEDSSKSEDDPSAADMMRELRLTGRQQTQLWEHVKKIENFWSTLPELEPGIIARMAKAAVERRWEVIFLTTRPSTAGELVQMQSQRWLAAHGFQYPSVYVVQRSRGRIADALALDAFVDDRPENCLDIAVESKAKVILVWHGNLTDVPAGAKRLGVQPVLKISEAMLLLEKLDDTRSKPGFMRSLRRALGSDHRER